MRNKRNATKRLPHFEVQMGQLLATDMNNQEFVGAVQNPDALLHVEFYMYKPMDKWQTEVKSQEAGRLVRIYGEEQPFVRIMRPGDQTTIIETSVREEHKQRWPEQWLYFQMREGLVETDRQIPGWRIEEWAYLDDKPDMLREFKLNRYSTVEQVAGASDMQVQKMGLGGVGFREQARSDLRKKMSADLSEAITAKDAEVAALAKKLDLAMEQIAKLTETVTAPDKKRG